MSDPIILDSSVDTFPFGQGIVWQPDAETVEAANLTRFMRRHEIDGIDTLVERAAADPSWFWDAVIDDLGIGFEKPYDRILDTTDGIQFPRWCGGGRMNIVHNCLDRWMTSEAADRIALRWEGEDGARVTLTYRELRAEVNRCANALRSLGLGRGDAVGLFMPMTPEIVIAFLAIAKVGGIILPLFSGYGASAISSRLSDAGAKALFTADGAFRRGRVVPMKSVADEAIASCPTLERVIVHRRTGIEEVPWSSGRDVWWHDLIPHQSDEAATGSTDAEDVVMIIHTSGTTGRPKGAVHTHCGFPIKSAQDMSHCMDLKPGETMYWMSDMGWMMGPWLVFGTLCIGASMLLYDGAPDYPDAGRLWQLVDDHDVTHLGISPTLIRSLRSHGTEPVQRHDVSRLRAACSTGSPWDPESWQWLFRNVLESRKPILNYSGGTEISGGILCGNFLKPLKPAAFSGPVPGMDVDIVDSNGNSVRGEVGELVLRGPWIGMTRGFWNDHQRYLDTYWSRFNDVWVHGDFAAVDSDGLWYILGRSDDTIKVAGKRLGPAEVEAILNAHESVAESAAIGAPHDVKGQEVVAFVVLAPGHIASDTLRTELIGRIVSELGKPLKPRDLRFVDSLPKTRNAKVMRRVIRATYLGEDPGDITSLEDPSTLDAIRRSR